MEKWIYFAFHNVRSTGLTCPRKYSAAARDARLARAQVAMWLHEEGQEQERDADCRTATFIQIQISKEVHKVRPFRNMESPDAWTFDDRRAGSLWQWVFLPFCERGIRS